MTCYGELSPEETTKKFRRHYYCCSKFKYKSHVSRHDCPNSHGAEYKKAFDEIYPIYLKI
jgi:hypothetical protein